MEPVRARRRWQSYRLTQPFIFCRRVVSRMRTPQFLARKTLEKVKERLTKPTCIANRIIRNDQRGRQIRLHPCKSVAKKHEKKPRIRPAHARGKSGRSNPCLKLASSLKNWTTAQSPRWLNAT